MSEPTFAIIIMGASGSGKTTLGRRLARQIGASLVEGDEYHLPTCVTKMRSGVPLDDDDRWPWLDRLADVINDRSVRERTIVCTCSALKRRYRDRLRLAVRQPICFVCLHANKALLETRLAERLGHYMPPSLLRSQLDILELPKDETDSITLSAAESPDDLVLSVLDSLKSGALRPGSPQQ